MRWRSSTTEIVYYPNTRKQIKTPGGFPETTDLYKKSKEFVNLIRMNKRHKKIRKLKHTKADMEVVIEVNLTAT